MTIAAALILSFLSSGAGVYLFRRIASRSTLLLDVPNERSSHSSAVVRGAGLVIALTVLLGYSVTAGSGTSVAYVITAASIATISFIDDLRSIPFVPRLIAHFSAAAALVYWCGGYPGIVLPLTGQSVDFGLSGVVITIVFIVWMTNAFNFMDGIDGLAGTQAVAAGVGWMLFGVASEQPAIAILGALIAGACLGFLLFNWQPASVFMGDVGSTFLGFTLATISLIGGDTSAPARNEGFMMAAAFLWLFLFDTVFTRLRQILQLRPFWQAHRDHIYQQIVVSGGAAHALVTSFFGVFAVLVVAATGLKIQIGLLPLTVLLIAGPIALLALARKKRLT